MTAPRRIQLSRARGWRKPEGAVVVVRMARRDVGWGNPYRIGVEAKDAAEAVALYRAWIESCLAPEHPGAAHLRAALETLRGRDLACWCKPGEPCHGDVLLEIANR